LADAWVVTGAGLVTAAGDDAGELCGRVAGGEPAPAAAEPPPARAIAAFDPARYVRRKGLRHLSRTSQLACSAAAQLELGLHPIPPGEVGVVLGSAWAALDSIVRFEREAWTEGPRFVDPGLFAETVANVPAGHVSIFFGWSALNATVVAGGASGLQAIVTALDCLAEGRAAVVVAGGADGVNQHVLRVRATHGVASESPRAERRDWVGGEGSCLLALESGEHAARRGARVLGVLRRGATCWSDPRGVRPLEPRIHLLRRLLDGAGLRPSEIDLIVTARGGSPEPDEAQERVLRETFSPEVPPRISAGAVLGETWGAAGAIGVALALECVQRGAPSGRGERDRPARDVLVIDGCASGHFGALLVSAAD